MSMNRVALVTGAGRGIGRAIALKLAGAGWDVAVNYRTSAAGAEEIASNIIILGRRAIAVQADVADAQAVRAMVADVEDRLGPVSLLVNNAGLAAGFEHLDRGSTADWNAMIDTNVKGLLYVSQIVARKMIAAGGGHIVNIGSIAGTEPYENGAVYCATKHAVHAISQSMRADLLSYGIKVSEVRPGMVETEFSVVRFHGDRTAADNVYRGVEPLTGDDIAEAIAWIAQLPAHMNVNEIVLMPSQQACQYYVHRKS